MFVSKGILMLRFGMTKAAKEEFYDAKKKEKKKENGMQCS